MLFGLWETQSDYLSMQIFSMICVHKFDVSVISNEIMIHSNRLLNGVGVNGIRYEDYEQLI